MQSINSMTKCGEFPTNHLCRRQRCYLFWIPCCCCLTLSIQGGYFIDLSHWKKVHRPAVREPLLFVSDHQIFTEEVEEAFKLDIFLRIPFSGRYCIRSSFFFCFGSLLSFFFFSFHFCVLSPFLARNVRRHIKARESPIVVTFPGGWRCQYWTGNCGASMFSSCTQHGTELLLIMLYDPAQIGFPDRV